MFFILFCPLADIISIRKGNHSHGELIYSSDFENGKKNDILAKQQDIRDTLTKLQSGKLAKEEKEACIDNLKSYSKEFPQLNEAIEIADSSLVSDRLKIKEKYLTLLADANEDKELIALVKSMSPQKLEEFRGIIDIKEKARLLNSDMDSVSSELFNSLLSEKGRSNFIKKLQSEIENAKIRLEALMLLENKDKVTQFEIESLQQVLKKYKTVFKL